MSSTESTSSTFEKFRKDLEQLIKVGDLMALDLDLREAAERRRQLPPGPTVKARRRSKRSAHDPTENEELIKKVAGAFERDYQSWYTEGLALLRQLLPDRVDEFRQLYETDRRRKTVDDETYSIQDWMNGLRATSNARDEKCFPDRAIVTMRLATQCAILKAARGRFKSTLFDLRLLVQADFMDSELEAARELWRCGFLRAAGALAGVVLEKHLSQVIANRALVVQRKKPTIANLNDHLKSAAVLDVPRWRQIQRLADIRNLCVHGDEREPTRDEIQELIAGIDGVVKTLH